MSNIVARVLQFARVRKKKQSWFQVKLPDGDMLAGVLLKNGSLELSIHSGWSESRVILAKQEQQHLLDWFQEILNPPT